MCFYFGSLCIFFMIGSSFCFYLRSFGIFSCPGSLFLFAFGCLVIGFLFCVESFGDTRSSKVFSLVLSFTVDTETVESIGADAGSGEV